MINILKLFLGSCLYILQHVLFLCKLWIYVSMHILFHLFYFVYIQNKIINEITHSIYCISKSLPMHELLITSHWFQHLPQYLRSPRIHQYQYSYPLFSVVCHHSVTYWDNVQLHCVKLTCFHTTVVTDGPLLVLDSQLSCGEGKGLPLDDLVDCLLLMELQVETLHSSWNPVQADPSEIKVKINALLPLL